MQLQGDHKVGIFEIFHLREKLRIKIEFSALEHFLKFISASKPHRKSSFCLLFALRPRNGQSKLRKWMVSFAPWLYPRAAEEPVHQSKALSPADLSEGFENTTKALNKIEFIAEFLFLSIFSKFLAYVWAWILHRVWRSRGKWFDDVSDFKIAFKQSFYHAELQFGRRDSAARDLSNDFGANLQLYRTF